MQTRRQRVEHALSQWLPAPDIAPQRLHEAMRYITLNGGKRIRPILVYATGAAIGVEEQLLDGPACAVELIHAYSLAHDDLPAMDNDDLRRGVPTCHIKYDEATAVLAGDALQSLAFHILAHDETMVNDPQRRLEMIDSLAIASGSRGMAGGQAIDLAAVGKELNMVELENMHIHKTGALIRASAKLAALSRSDVDLELIERLDHYAKCIGLAFQVRDDILDVESDTNMLGKTQGADAARNKPTYPSLIGLVKAKEMAQDLVNQALESLNKLGKNADLLRQIARYIIDRQS
ncbi:MAG: (2E,6E)-farnesyl diphosphate synthase [Gammaproteobacteria bacterium]|nr:(2E,6E)-farnesyl diphosphate synthase [Gammaproteobacteria bacterium]